MDKQGRIQLIVETDCRQGNRVVVQTLNTTYLLEVIDPKKNSVRISGGRWIEPTNMIIDWGHLEV
ncbi:MAG: hypothetical protein V1738_02515 [Patescibacteria group bacterium]